MDCKPGRPFQTLRPSRRTRTRSQEWAPSSSHALNDRRDIGSWPSGERCEPRTTNVAPGPLLWAHPSCPGTCPGQRHAQNERRTLVCANAPSSQCTLRCVSARFSPPRRTEQNLLADSDRRRKPRKALPDRFDPSRQRGHTASSSETQTEARAERDEASAVRQRSCARARSESVGQQLGATAQTIA